MSSITDPIRLVQDLLAGLSSRLHSRSATRAELTSVVLGVLADMGRARGFNPYHTDRASGANEFLLDHIWLSPGRMELAVESEWGSLNHIQDDFEKLLHVKCPLKLMICAPKAGVGVLLPKLELYVAKYEDHRVGEQYVLVDLRLPTGSAQCFRWMPPCDGRVSEDQARFMPVEGSPFAYADRALAMRSGA